VLTPYQRRVLVALASNGLPIDVLAEPLSTTRGAPYKTLHDARRSCASIWRTWSCPRYLAGGGELMERPELKQALGRLLGSAGTEVQCARVPT
jgi:hypothetical protein